MRLRDLLSLPPEGLKAWAVAVPAAVGDAIAAAQTGRVRIAPSPMVDGRVMIGADLLAHEGDMYHALIHIDAADCQCMPWPAAVAALDRYEGDDAAEPPAWVQVLGAGLGPVGAVDGYAEGATVAHGGNVWVSTTAGNVWEPGVSGWRRQGEAGAPPPWQQPTGAHDAYALGAVVSHAGKVWASTAAANAWEPGVFGWAEVI
jgi:hypothetical protein